MEIGSTFCAGKARIEKCVASKASPAGLQIAPFNALAAKVTAELDVAARERNVRLAVACGVDSVSADEDLLRGAQ